MSLSSISVTDDATGCKEMQYYAILQLIRYRKTG